MKFRIVIVCISMLFTFNFNLKAQNYNSFYGTIITNSSIDTLTQDLTEFENLGIKESGTSSLTNTLVWLKNKYLQYGYTNLLIDTFSYNGDEVYNLIVTKQGTVYPNTYVIIDGHYDTKNGPGTNDNGSGTAAILEIARLLNNVSTEYSIKFIHFSMEEPGLVGSSHYVNDIAYPSGMDIKIVFNIDQVGGDNSKINNTIKCERDETFPFSSNAASSAYTDTLAVCMELYSNLTATISNAYSSDYMPFQAKNYVITGLYEANATPYSHSINDSLSKLDIPYLFEVTKGAIGASLYFAVAKDTSNSMIELSERQIKIYPNPVADYLTIEFLNQIEIRGNYEIINNMGQIVKSGSILTTNSLLNLKELKNGLYFIKILNDKGTLIYKLIKK